ncbi:MAG: FAD:protein FMN transferase [Eubacterium sp.]
MKKKLKWAMIGVALMVLLLLNAGCSQKKIVTRTDFVLDTVVTLTVYGETNEDILAEPFALIRSLNDKFDVFSESSELSKINQSAGIEPVKVSEDTFELIKKGLDYGRETEGAFDIAIGPLVELWNIKNPEDGKIPEIEKIHEAQKKVDYQKVILNENDKTVFLKETGMKLNLGAIAKGYIGDRVKILMEEKGVAHGVINLGGNVVLIGGKNQRTDFNIGVENPEDTAADPIGMLQLSGKSVVTSGDYQRYFIGEDGKRYHHILDPKTGYPSNSGLHQVTIVADSSVDADALSTACFLLGAERSIAYLKNFENVEAIFVTEDNHILVTKGLEKDFVFDAASYGKQYQLEIME